MRRLWLLALAGVVAGCAVVGSKADIESAGKRDPIPLEAAAGPPIEAAIGLTNSHKATGDLALFAASPAAVVDGRRYPLRVDSNRGLILGAGTATIGTVSLAAGGGVVDTELAAAAALADNAANPTTPMVGANLSAWDGATWDRVTNGSGVLASALRVTIATDDPVNDALSVVGAGVVATAQRVTLGSDDPAVTALQILDNAIAGTEMQVDVVASLPAGANNIGDVDIVTFPDNEPFNVAQIGGAATTAGAGVVAAGTQRTTLASDDPAVTALQIMDDWDEANRAAVNPIAGQIGIAGGTGVDGATVPRVTLATNVGLPAGANNIGDVDVLTVPALIAGTATIGSVGAIVNALPTGTNNIGDVDVLTVNGVAPAFGTGVVGATVSRVTLATDDELNDDADAIRVAAELIDNAIAGTEMQVDVVASLPAGANNIGDVDVLTINGQAPAFGAGVVGATVQRVTVATDDVVSVDWNGTAPPIGGGVQATALRITTATDSPGVVAPDAAFPANTMAISARASTAKPAAMSGDADAVGIWTSRVGSVRTLSGEVALVTSSTLGADLAIVAANTGNRLVLVTVRERSGATATLVVRHGTLDSDIQIVPISLAANGVAVYQFPGGVNCQSGVFLDWLSGSMEVTIGTEDHE